MGKPPPYLFSAFPSFGIFVFRPMRPKIQYNIFTFCAVLLAGDSPADRRRICGKKMQKNFLFCLDQKLFYRVFTSSSLFKMSFLFPSGLWKLRPFFCSIPKWWDFRQNALFYEHRHFYWQKWYGIEIVDEEGMQVYDENSPYLEEDGSEDLHGLWIWSLLVRK